MTDKEPDITLDPYDEQAEYLALTQEMRWTRILDCMMGSPGKITVTAVANILHVDRRTLYRDLGSPAFFEFRKRFISDYIDNNLMTHAFKNISKAVMQDHCLKTSKWLIEHFGTKDNMGVQPNETRPVVLNMNFNHVDEVKMQQVFATMRDFDDMLKQNMINMNGNGSMNGKDNGKLITDGTNE